MSDPPFLAEHIIGYRQWLAIYAGPEHGHQLCPLFTCTLSQPWQPGVNTAKCFPASSVGQREREPHTPPGPDGDDGCHCGLYARHDITEAMRRDHIKGRVTGVIQAWGDIEVHHDGFRARHARVLALARSSEHREQLEDLGLRYDVPVLPLDHLPGYARRYGTPVPARFVPQKPQPRAKKEDPSHG